MAVKINLGEWGSVFALPTSIVDKHLKIASPLQLRIILFLLRNSQETYTNEQLAKLFSVHEDDIADSIEFWIDRGLICCCENQLVPVDSKVETNNTEEKLEATSEKPAKRTRQLRTTKPDIISAAQRVSGDLSLQHLLCDVEIALAKPLSSGDTATIVMLYDTCGLPVEVIAMLVHYCVSIDKGNMRTIEKIGLQWADSGVNTLELADEKISQIKASNENWSKVKGIFGLKNVGSPTKKQLEYANRWLGEWHFSSDMLRLAYEKCVDQTGNFSMQYINKILKVWYFAGAVKPDDVEKLDNKKSNGKSKGSKASYDISDLEKIQ